MAYASHFTAGRAGQTSSLAWAKPGVDLKTVREALRAAAQKRKPSFFWRGFLCCSRYYYCDLGNLPNLPWRGLPRMP